MQPDYRTFILDEGSNVFDRNRWLARLSFSFFIIALVLSWQAYKISSAPGAEDSWRAGLLLAGAVLAGILGAAGVRARHRRDDK